MCCGSSGGGGGCSSTRSTLRRRAERLTLPVRSGARAVDGRRAPQAGGADARPPIDHTSTHVLSITYLSRRHQRAVRTARPPAWPAWLLVLAGLLAGAAPSAAQGPLADLVLDLIGRQFALSEEGPHRFHYEGAADVARSVNGSLIAQLVNANPLSSASGGVAFEWDPEANSFARRTDSFGPIFTERAETLGQGKYNFGWSYLRFDFDEIDGIPLASGDLRFEVEHEDQAPFDGTTFDNPVEGDLVEFRLRLGASTETFLLFATFGISDRLDIGLGIPLVTVDVDARLEARIVELSTEGALRDGRPIHRFAGGSTQAEFSSSGSDGGIGDLILRGKYRLTRQEGRGLATAAEVRLPTGDEENLLGTGSTQFKLLLIGSARFGKVSPHVNLGYTWASGGDRLGEPPEQSHLAFGFDIPLNDKVTVAAELLARTQYGARSLVLSRETHLYRPCAKGEGGCAPDRGGPVAQLQRGVLASRPDDLNQVLGTAGVKIRLPTQKVVLANFGLLYSLASDGLQDTDLVAVIGFDIHL